MTIFKTRLPNALTISRLAVVPALGVAVCVDAPGVATALFATASVTDFLDGYLARRWRVESPFGEFLDPVVDKLLVSIALISLSAKLGAIVAGPAATIVAREISVSALREWCGQRGRRDAVKVGWAGKVKTATQMIALTLLLATLNMEATSTLRLAALVLLYLATFLTVQSGLIYFQDAWPMLTSSSSPDEKPAKKQAKAS